MKILFDTSALIALLVKSEASHIQMEKYVEQQQKLGSRFLVTDYVLDELFTRILYDYGAKAAKTCIQVISKQLQEQALYLFPISSDLFKLAQELFLEMAVTNLSFTDVTSLVVYQRYKIDEMCTLDGGFRKAGVNVSYFEKA